MKRGRVLEYEQQLVSNSSSSQRLSPHHTTILKVAAVTIYVGKVHLGKEFGWERTTRNCLSHFLLANCTWKQHLSGCCCLICLLNYENLRSFMHVVWKLNLVSLITALHSGDGGCVTKLWCLHMANRDKPPAINAHYHWQCEVQWLVCNLPYLIFQLQGQLWGFLTRCYSHIFYCIFK